MESTVHVPSRPGGTTIMVLLGMGGRRIYLVPLEHVCGAATRVSAAVGRGVLSPLPRKLICRYAN